MIRKLAVGIIGAGVLFGGLAFAGAAQADTSPDVTVVWSMPSWTDSTTPSWSQTYVSSTYQTTPSLDVAIPTTCGTQYQVDTYVNDATTQSLIAGGTLNGPNSPTESFATVAGGSGWGFQYKLVQNAACVTPPPVVVPPVVVPPVVTPPVVTPPVVVAPPAPVVPVAAQSVPTVPVASQGLADTAGPVSWGLLPIGFLGIALGATALIIRHRKVRA